MTVECLGNRTVHVGRLLHQLCADFNPNNERDPMVRQIAAKI